MDFRKLEAFCKVYELKSFSKAGLELQLSQPTISAHVANLEEELGVPLFDRLGRTVLPTQAGEVLYRGAKQVFQQVGRINSEIGLLRDMVVGDLLLGGSTIPANYILPNLLKSFLALYPSLRVHLTIGDTDSIIRQVGQGRLELGVVGSQPEQQGIAFYPLRRRACACGRSGDRRRQTRPQEPQGPPPLALDPARARLRHAPLPGDPAQGLRHVHRRTQGLPVGGKH